jgi:hypothetical protein
MSFLCFETIDFDLLNSTRAGRMTRKESSSLVRVGQAAVQVGSISLHATTHHQANTTISLISGDRPSAPPFIPGPPHLFLGPRSGCHSSTASNATHRTCASGPACQVASQPNPAVWGGECRNSTPCSLPVGGRRTDGLKIPPSASRSKRRACAAGK